MDKIKKVAKPRRLLRGSSAFILLLALAACKEIQEPIIPDRLTLEHVPAGLAEGDTARLLAKVFAGEQQLNNAPVTWSSSDTALAMVDATGLVRARASGSVTITARSGLLGETAMLTITQRVLLAGPALDSVPPTIALGVYVGCALSGGRAYCWGDNRFQYLAVVDTAREILEPKPVVGTFSFRAIYVSAANGPRCGLIPTGKAVCWGVGMSSPTTPAIVAPELSFVTLAIGDTHTCGIDANGVVYCWGSNTSGQLGRPQSAPVATPQAVSLPEKMVAVTAGYEQTCSLSISGVVYCWGLSGPGLGRGELPLAVGTAPAPVQSAVKFARLYGDTDNCALTRYGEVYCWGHPSQSDLPAYTPTLLTTTQRFVKLTKSSGHTCGLTRENIAYCWGRNETGQLGNGTSSGGLTPIPVPFAVAGGLRFNQIETGLQFTCGITMDGAAYCWGTRQYGRLADGYSWIRYRPVVVAPQESFVDITSVASNSGGGRSAQCALTTSGKPYCWGSEMGRIVASNVADVAVPTAVPTSETFIEIDGGRDNICLLTTSGLPRCGGSSYTTTPGLTPVQSSQSFVSLSAGAFHACALTAGGEAYCWGANESGQLGTGDFIKSPLSARAVSTKLRFTRISAGSTYTCAVATDSALYCWGGDYAGRLGHASLVPCGAGECTNTPALISDMPPVTDAETSDFITCGLAAGGRAYCFGASETASELCYFGALGPRVSCQRTPTAVNDVHTFHSLYRNGALDETGFPYIFGARGAGYAAFRLEDAVPFARFAGQCGLTVAQKMFCWGSNEFGAVGDGVPNIVSVPTAIAGSLRFDAR